MDLPRLTFSRHVALQRLANLPLLQRIAIVALLPALLALALVTSMVWSAYDRWSASASTAAEIAAAREASALVHELQRERGFAVLLATRPDQAVARAYAGQHRRTDTRRETMAEALGELRSESAESAVLDGITSLDNRLVNLANLRQSITRGEVAAGDAAEFYTQPISDYVVYVERAGQAQASAAVRQRLVALAALLRSKEAAGRERAAGAAGRARGHIDQATHDAMVAFNAARLANEQVFAHYADPAQVAALGTLNAGTNARTLEDLRAAAVAGAATDPRSATLWWNSATGLIDEYHTLANTIARDLEEAALGEASQARWTLLGLVTLMLVGLPLLALVVMAVARSIVRPVQALAETTQRMSEGDFASAAGLARSEDEIGALAGRIRAFAERLGEAERERAAHTAERERQVAAIEARARRVDTLTAGFDANVGHALGTFAQSTSALLGAARELDAKAVESAERSAAVASASQQTNANVRIVAEATEELSLSIEEIVRQVLASSQNMAEAVAEVRQTHGDMAVLRSAASQIGTIVTLIGDIAEQTNILALNATIEAARADTAGYGFAVVATEVRALANQTAEATRSIARSVAEVTENTRRAGLGMDRIAVTIGQAEQAAMAISAALEQQSAAAHSIAQNVQEAACGVAQVDSNIVAIGEASNRARDEVESVVGAADEFGARAGSLERQVQDFLTAIRAA